MFYRLIILILIFTSFTGKAQLYFKELNWIPPVDIPIYLSGNFAELRTGHLHAGIDIKTQGKEGFKVYAVQDGYIFRIKISSGGYGNAIYIKHPDGYTSVYAHLKEYNIQLDEYVKKIQYQKESFEVDIFPKKNELIVKQGDVIGLTGNTGSSAGPHLHFEIRDTKNSHPMNGLFLGYNIKDNIPPIMEYLYIYPQSRNSSINGKNIKQYYKLVKKDNGYSIKQGDTLLIKGIVGLGLKVNDYLNGSGNRCGVYKTEVFIDGDKIFQDKFDGISFSETRYVNSLMDYSENVNRKRKLYKLYVEPNNRLSIYSNIVNRGLFNLTKKDNVKKITIVTNDAYFNSSTLTFFVKYDNNEYNFKNNDVSKIVIPWQNSFVLDTLGVVANIDRNSLYDTLRMEFNVDTIRKKNQYSPMYSIHNKNTAIHKYYMLSIVPDEVPDSLKSKLLLAQFDKNKYKSVGGEYENGVVKAKVREFGKYTVIIDTVKPVIELLGVDSLGVDKSISFKIYDDISGIKSYKGTVDDKWLLFKYDAKNDKIIYTYDDSLKIGVVDLKIEVIDNKDNISVLSKRCTLLK